MPFTYIMIYFFLFFIFCKTTSVNSGDKQWINSGKSLLPVPQYPPLLQSTTNRKIWNKSNFFIYISVEAIQPKVYYREYIDAYVTDDRIFS